MSARVEPGRPEAETLLVGPALLLDEPLSHVCTGCGDCCRARKDLLLSGYDLWRVAWRLGLPPRLTAQAFCRETVGKHTLLPTLRLAPQGKNGDCPFLEESACAVHSARPLACALYPLGQRIDLATGRAEYYLQLPACGSVPPQPRTLRRYLEDAGIQERFGVDVQWARYCTALTQVLLQAGGAENPRFRPAVRRIARALYYDYSIREDFYPQFMENTETLNALLPRLLGSETARGQA